MEGLNLDISGPGLNKWILEVEIHTRVVWRLEYETKLGLLEPAQWGRMMNTNSCLRPINSHLYERDRD